MPVKSWRLPKFLRQLLEPLRARATGEQPMADDEETPLRAELFSADQMEQHGKVLADSHVLADAGRGNYLLDRLAENREKIIDTCNLLTASVKAGIPITPAGEWLLDNFHLIEQEIRTARKHLPRDYSRELPLLAQGPSKGLPRVYDIALEAIAHGDGHLSSDTLARFVAAYQTVTLLTLGELWAIPIMLRLALIENLRRVSTRIRQARSSVNQAQEWAKLMIAVADRDPKSLILVVADMARSNPPMASAFVAELARQLRGHGAALALPLTWIDQRLAESSQTIEQLIQSENQQQAADQVSISNSIGSLRFLRATDWRGFVEFLSSVERVLITDPTDTYRKMDFATRDQYRQVIDTLARSSPLSQTQIASAAIDLANAGEVPSASALLTVDFPIGIRPETPLETSADLRTSHVGYYLLGAGKPKLEEAIRLRPSLWLRVRRAFAASPLAVYLGSITIVTELIVAALIVHAFAGGVAPWLAIVLGALLVLVASQVASILTNWIATLIVTPQRLPRMDYARGVPAEMRTLVVVPTLITGSKNVEELLESIEVRYLGNRDEALHFALLTDFRDAAEETLPEDGPLLIQAQKGIEALNTKYRTSRLDRFFLLHRPRRWNAAERVWMGYERKRGKLAEVNALLRGSGEQYFALMVGDTSALIDVRYVITLDTDTQLPRDSAAQMVGTMAHPLNVPEFDEAAGRVTVGYGILQPRVASSLTDPNRSHYSNLWGADAGIDPYTRAVSDVYQDLFGEGSFIGKGIYDVDAFERALKGRLPENRILSHDLLEGCYARSALLSDVDLFEEYPPRHDLDVSRQWRWIRGDWQIASWMLPRVPTPDGGSAKNPLSMLSRWKIFDNLRRSLCPAAMLLIPLLAWFTLPYPWFWTLVSIGAVLFPPLLIGSVDFVRRPEDVHWLRHSVDRLRDLGRHVGLAAFRIMVLPYEALFTVDAILRTLWRMGVSHHNLLGWSASASEERRPESGIVESFSVMWFTPVYAAALAGAIGWLRPEALFAAAPLLILWFCAPAGVWWVNRPLRAAASRLSPTQSQFLRATARRTWGFFETFVCADDHWLPPDNYQEEPGNKIAHRTSPTNMGMALLANLTAREFGYISAGRFLERTTRTFETLASLERHEGHFFNWYDTQSLQPLRPRYISSVDSGNLAGHLLTLRGALVNLPERRIVEVHLFDGLADTLSVLAAIAPETGRGPLHALQQQVSAASAVRPTTLTELVQRLERVERSAQTLVSSYIASHQRDAEKWADALVRQCRDALDELRTLVPWITLPAAPPGMAQLSRLDEIPTLADIVRLSADAAPSIERRLRESAVGPEHEWLERLKDVLAAAGNTASERITQIDHLVHQAEDFSEMEYDFLYDNSRHLLSIGFNVDDMRRDNSFYDLLASESRLSTFVAIAQGQLPQESWFALGRARTSTGGQPVLLSWSGSMFEYLMPLLVMPSYNGSLLDQTCRAAVERQIDFGHQRGLPWGVSECAYSTLDASMNYQYRAFGVPTLGLQRGLAEDSIVAPYASALALMVAPDAACTNLQLLAERGLSGDYGFFEAIDYTPSRLGRGQSSAIVRCFMAHHQGMILLSLAHLLLGRPLQQYFESDPVLKSALLLLQERVPKHSVFHNFAGGIAEVGSLPETVAAERAPIGADTAIPEVNLLSNGRYHVMMTNAGGGYCRWRDLAVTRWREDGTCDNWGSFVYVRDVMSGEYWSTGYQPTTREAQSYEATFSEGRAEYRRRDHDYETYAEVVVSPEDDIDVRRVRVTNHARVPRTIEITSYGEVVLARPDADLSQPAFSNLFVETEVVKNRQAIVCTRRPRAAGEPTPWMFHLCATHGVEAESLSYETDRMRFLGRGQSVATPDALVVTETLSNSAGSVLDPIVSIRCRIHLEVGQSATIDFVTGAADTREACNTLVDKYQDRHLADRAFDLAGTHGGVALRQINATEADARLYARLASSVLFTNTAQRAEASVLLQNRRGQSGLWGYSISGDLPIVLLRIGDTAQIDFARQMIQCHAYWRLKGLAVDLVIWNEDHDGYRQQLQDQIVGLIAHGVATSGADHAGGVYVRQADQIAPEDRTLMQAVARVIISDTGGSLAEQINRRPLGDKRAPRLSPTRTSRIDPNAVVPVPKPEDGLVLVNPLGGFTADGREYVITTGGAHQTPTPWVNILANPNFGSVISESGNAYTWSQNAHEYRLTPWSDDAVSASSGEAFYLRDEETGRYWSPTPLPVRGRSPYTTRHGFGYSVFEHSSGGVRSELWIYVDIEDPVKFAVLKVRNGSGRARRLSATGYVEWVLGDARAKSAMHTVTEIDATSGALFARNPYNTEFGSSVAFLDVDDTSRTLTGDRAEFIGRNGRLAKPEAMSRLRLSGRLGAGLDPCGAIHVPFELADGAEREIIFRLGAGTDIEATRKLVQRLRKTGSARAALERVRQHWSQTLGAVQIDTPDRGLNMLANGWLVYQVLACRLWARSGYYQSGGAFGFRDQLQDAMALVHTTPGVLREQVLRCASRQFPEGDVQHWWHPPMGRGVRTRCSDDYLWLPFATTRYVTTTSDVAILDEPIYYLEGRVLGPDEESYYDLPGRSAQSAPLYEHCTRALVHGVRLGEHGLPLMGSGDWNDGMNMVGIKGRGESVWLAFFLYEALQSFAPIAEKRGDAAFAGYCRAEADKLRQNTAAHAWDGEWYRRAYFDDGTPLGSSSNEECSIDSIAQSWSVLSGAGDADRQRQAMDSLDRRLVHRDHRLIQLLDPPFDKSAMNPGYIKGYVPGVRENGGQYTHAAVWAAMAFAALGDGRRAWELLAMIIPVNHALTADQVAIYRTEPYVVAADVYALPPHTGRGGWTWYTGSAGWTYRLILESLLGVTLSDGHLNFAPKLPEAWTGMKMRYRYRDTSYDISFTQLQADGSRAAGTRVVLDGVDQDAARFVLNDDRNAHVAEVTIVRAAQSPLLAQAAGGGATTTGTSSSGSGATTSPGVGVMPAPETPNPPVPPTGPANPPVSPPLSPPVSPPVSPPYPAPTPNPVNPPLVPPIAPGLPANPPAPAPPPAPPLTPPVTPPSNPPPLTPPVPPGISPTTSTAPLPDSLTVASTDGAVS